MWWLWLLLGGYVAIEEDTWPNEEDAWIVLFDSITLPFGGDELMDEDPEEEVDPESLSLDPPLLLPSNKTQIDPFSPIL